MKKESLGWRSLAACRGLPVDRFFDGRAYPAAQAYCARCVVAEACLFQALVEEQPDNPGDSVRRFGVRGGCTPQQRQEIADHCQSNGLEPHVLLALEEQRWRELDQMLDFMPIAMDTIHMYG